MDENPEATIIRAELDQMKEERDAMAARHASELAVLTEREEAQEKRADRFVTHINNIARIVGMGHKDQFDPGAVERNVQELVDRHAANRNPPAPITERADSF